MKICANSNDNCANANLQCSFSYNSGSLIKYLRVFKK